MSAQTRAATAPLADESRTAGRGLVVIAGAKVYFIVTSYAIQLALPHLLKSAETFGLYATAMSGVSILNNVLIAATIQTVSRFTSAEEAQAKTTLRQALYTQAVLGGGLALALFGGADALAAAEMDPALGPLYRISSGIVLSYAVYAALVGHLNGARRFGAQATLDITFSTFRTGGILAGAALGAGALGAVVGFTGAALAILLVALVAVGVGTRGSTVSLREWLAFMAPIWLYQSFLNGVLQIDIQVMKRTIAELGIEGGLGALDAAALASTYSGYYRAAQTFAFVPYQLLLSMTFVVFPMVSRATASGDEAAARATIRGALRFSLLVLLAISAPIAGAADGVMTLAYPAEYSVGASALAILVFAMAAFALFVIAATVLSSAGRPGVAAAIAGVSLVVVVVANRVLLVRAGIGPASLGALASGTAIGTVVALVASASAVYLRFRTFIGVATALRTAAASVAAFATAAFVPHAGKVGSLAALIAGFAAFVVVALVLGEIRKEDLAQIRAMLGKR